MLGNKLVSYVRGCHFLDDFVSIWGIETQACHLPALDNQEGVLNLFTVCILAEMSNVLSLKTYQSGGMPAKDREHCVQARHRSRDLLDWFFSRYELVHSDEGQIVILDGMNDVYWPYVVRITKGLIQYKKLAAGEDILDSEDGCTAAAVEAQIKNCFHDVAGYDAAWASWTSETVDSLAWPIDTQHAFEVRVLAAPKKRQGNVTDIRPQMIILTLLVRGHQWADSR